MTERAPRVRNVCFTVNATDGIELLLLDFDHPTWQHVKYCVYQREMAGHEHFQGYLELTEAKTYDALHNIEGLEHAHFAARKGPANKAAHYCKKPVPGCACDHCEKERDPLTRTKLEGPFEFGEISRQGLRADILAVKLDIDRGVTLKRIWMDPEHFPVMVKHHRAMETYKHLTTPPRTVKPIVFLFIGPSGLGKSRTMWNIARALAGESVYKVPPKSTGFWCDRYEQEDVFIVDEMGGHKCTPEFFNELCDWEQMDVPAHGTLGRQFNSKYLFIGTNYHPKYWWKKRSDDQVKQTMRRINVIFKMFPPPKPQQLCPYCAQGLCAFHHL
nr:MAG TPA: Rep protein [Cressdnaviricota sp.]